MIRNCWVAFSTKSIICLLSYFPFWTNFTTYLFDISQAYFLNFQKISFHKIIKCYHLWKVPKESQNQIDSGICNFGERERLAQLLTLSIQFAPFDPNFLQLFFFQQKETSGSLNKYTAALLYEVAVEFQILFFLFEAIKVNKRVKAQKIFREINTVKVHIF